MRCSATLKHYSFSNCSIDQLLRIDGDHRWRNCGDVSRVTHELNTLITFHNGSFDKVQLFAFSNKQYFTSTILFTLNTPYSEIIEQIEGRRKISECASFS